MEKFLLQLLKDNNRVIVPDLGAFIIRHDQPDEMVFNDLLAFNDGMFADYVAKHEGISEEEALQQIEEYVASVKKDLESGKTLILNGLGILSMESGRISLGSETKTKTKTKTKTVPKSPETIPSTETAEEKSSAKDDKQTKEENPAEPEQEIAAAEETEKSADLPEESSEPEEEMTTDEITPGEAGSDFTLEEDGARVDVDASADFDEANPKETNPEEPPFTVEDEAAFKEESLEDIVVGETEEEEEEEEETITGPGKAAAKASVPEPVPVPEPVMATPKVAVQQEKSKTGIWTWIGGIAASLVIVLFIAWFLIPESLQQKIMGKKTQKEIPVETAKPAPDSPAAVPEMAEQETRAPEPEEISVPAPPAMAKTKQYYLVAGVFQELKNAEEYVAKLQAKGYNASIFGMRKNMHAVCFDSFDSKEEAIRKLELIRNDVEPTAWVLYY